MGWSKSVPKWSERREGGRLSIGWLKKVPKKRWVREGGIINWLIKHCPTIKVSKRGREIKRRVKSEEDEGEWEEGRALKAVPDSKTSNEREKERKEWDA